MPLLCFAWHINYRGRLTTGAHVSWQFPRWTPRGIILINNIPSWPHRYILTSVQQPWPRSGSHSACRIPRQSIHRWTRGAVGHIGGGHQSKESSDEVEYASVESAFGVGKRSGHARYGCHRHCSTSYATSDEWKVSLTYTSMFQHQLRP